MTKPELLSHTLSVDCLCRFFRHCLVLFCLALTISAACAQTAGPQLAIRPPRAVNDWIRLGSSIASEKVLTLEASVDFVAWREIGTFHDALFEYPDLASSGLQQRFYRMRMAPRGTNDDGKNQIVYPFDPFASSRFSDDLRWVKFAILLQDPSRVHYQDTMKFPFHYDFASRRLPPFVGMDYGSFEAAALHRTNQQVVLGSVLFAPEVIGVSMTEYGVQFVGADAYTAEEIAPWFNLVRATVHFTNDLLLYYMPTFEQSEMVRTNAAAFAALGIPIASVERWTTVNTCYSPGWAFGRLKYFPASEVVAAFSDGRLRPNDILLTDGVPADTPMVAGIISLAASTPNSHTALLAMSFGVPFVYLPDANDRTRAQQLAGRKIVLRAAVDRGVADVRILDVEEVLDPATEAELLTLKAPKPIQFMPKRAYGAISASTDGLVPTDIQYFGGKAANYGFLRRQVPSNCPVALAFSFDLWDEFLEQTVTGGRTLRTEIAARLAPHTNYPPEIVSMKAALAAIRDLFTKNAGFTVAQQQAITNSLRLFSPGRKIRFRSSTNVEDSENFIGAGLYDSFSGCLMDDLDDDTSGPSHCDSTENNERGVFRAIQRVYAGFYNDDAYLERLRHQVDETKVAMGVLVHHSFPDEEELANGVATPHFTFTEHETNISAEMVTQLGAVSVTNPDGASAPEVVTALRKWHYGVPDHRLGRRQGSSLVPLGAYVMDWQADYSAFMDLFVTVGDGFRQFYPAKTDFHLDFEYKKDVNLGLMVKQVREVPRRGGTNQVVPFLINEPTLCSIEQGGRNVFAIHRLKSRWTLHTANMRLEATNLANGIYTQGTVEYVDGDGIRTLTGPINSWPNASVSPSGSINYWTTGTGAAQRSWRLDTVLRTNVVGAPPIFTQHDFRRTITVTYPGPMPRLESMTGTSTDAVTLDQPTAASTGVGLLRERTLTHSNGIKVETSYYLQSSFEDIQFVNPPLLRFVQTRISGLTATPIVLTNFYSQSYGNYNHGSFEEFIFEPRLEPGMPAAVLAELNAANIQLICIEAYGGQPTAFHYLGLDQMLHNF